MEPKTYHRFCENPHNNPSGSEGKRLKFSELTSTIFSTSNNQDEMTTEVMIDMGPVAGMNDGLIVFMKTPDELGGTIQVLHNIIVHPSGKSCNVPFAFFNVVEDGAV